MPVLARTLILLLGAFAILPAAELPSAVSRPVDFGREVHPILNAKCAGCHNSHGAQGGLAVNTRAEMLKGGVSGPSIVPGKSADSLLIHRVAGVKLPIMPMGGKPLSAEEIGVLRAWIDQGAKIDTAPTITRWTPILAPRSPQVPPGAHPVDAFLAAYFQKHKVTPGQPVSDEVFVRRAMLDLHGLLPTPEQRRTFLADTRPDKRTRLLDELLANRTAFAEHWISFWNDLLHNDEGVTYIGDRKSITPWLEKALRDNLPYDQFVRALLNPAKPDGPEGFLMGVNWRGDINASQMPVMQAAQNSAQVFLGVNLKCNSCHDSFISQWKLKDAYGLASFYTDQPLEIARCDAKTGETATPKFLYPELGSIDANATLAERRAAAARLFTAPENGRLQRTFVNRVWKRLMGRGLVDSVDDMDAEPWHADLLDWLASDFTAHGHDVNHLLRRIMTSQAYQLPASGGPDGMKPGAVFRGPLPRRLTAEQFVDAISSVTGEWPVMKSSRPEPGRYVRDWHLKPSSLVRALGRPTRDLAVTERIEDPSTLQMLELVNGQTLATHVQRGAKRLMGALPPAPEPLFDSGSLGANKATVDIDITGLKELRLMIEDDGSYDASRVTAGWINAEFEGPQGAVPLTGKDLLQLKGGTPEPALLGKVPSERVFALAGKNYTRFRATVGVEMKSLASDISPRVRFFVFDRAPDRRQMVRATGEVPVPRPPTEQPKAAIIQRVFEHLLGRMPSEAERKLALSLLSSRTPSDGLEDLLWILLLSPEFQYVS